MMQSPNLEWLSSFRASVYVYRGDDTPKWCEDKDGEFSVADPRES